MGMGKGASQRSFGHYGMASSFAFADPRYDLAVSFTTSRMLSASDQRIRELLDVMWDAII